MDRLEIGKIKVAGQVYDIVDIAAREQIENINIPEIPEGLDELVEQVDELKNSQYNITIQDETLIINNNINQ